MLAVAAGPASAQATRPATSPVPAKPPLRDFVGLCAHTVQFRPALYRPVARLVRDYHPVEWDLGDDTAAPTQFPLARNRVDWADLYGGWTRAGFDVNASLMFDNVKPAAWKHLGPDAEAYGKAVASHFGPSHGNVVSAVEIGNEPGKYSDEQYRTLFEHMARGVRAGDPKVTVLTCNMTAGKSGAYEKSLETVRGLEPLYDVINVHTYAQAEPWPTWRRSYPEDPKIPYLKAIRDVLAWRDGNAPGKGVWVTEFGWDASTKRPPKDGDFKKWVGSTEVEQARYVVRSYLVFASMDVGRAYLYWFNDDDKPQIHGSSGLTRDFKPKPAYWAVAHLLASLGDYRFARAVREEAGGVYLYEFQHATDAGKRVRVAWLATGSDRTAEHTLETGGGRVANAERTPLAEGKPEVVRWEAAGDGSVRATLTESPAYFWLEGR